MSLNLDPLRRCHVAVDLGAARTRVYLRRTGLVVDEPSAAAVNTLTGGLIAVGLPAERMDGRTPDHIRVIRPVSAGRIVDIDIAQRMLRTLVGEKLRRALRRRPLLRAAISVPHEADPLTQRAAVETLGGLRVRRVELVNTLLAAAVGSGLPAAEPEATLVAVCGATTTQVAVLVMGEVVAAEEVPVGGETIDRAVVQHLRHRHGVLLRGRRGRPLHLILDTADGDPATEGAEVYGRDVATGQPRALRIGPEAVRDAIQAPLTALLDGIREVLHRCPPDLVADLVDRGVVLTGGSARLPGLDTLLREDLGIPVRVAENPDGCVVRGLGALVEGWVTAPRQNPVRF